MNHNLPYPDSVWQALNRYRIWADDPDGDVIEEDAAMAELTDACYAHSYDPAEVMQRERL